jgi:hypothetical protein
MQAKRNVIDRRSVLLAPLVTGVAMMFEKSDSYAAAGTFFPGSSWEQVPESELSTSSRQGLQETRSYLQTLATTALVAVRDGRIIFSYGPSNVTSIVTSVRKSVLSMMYGKYVANGTIDIERTLADVGIDDLQGLLPVERQAKVRDLLTARSGVYHPSSNIYGDDHKAAPQRGSQTPGEYFLYSNWDFNAAGAVFEKLTRRDIYRAFAEDFVIPLQLEDFNESLHRHTGDITRSQHLSYPFYLSTRDMARLGYLMLNDGNWRGQEIVPPDWVKRTTTSVTGSADMHPAETAKRQIGYGYLWWVLEEPPSSPLNGAYMAWGQYGQFILVVPKQRMVIAHKRKIAETGNGDIRRVTAKELFSATKMLIAACG